MSSDQALVIAHLQVGNVDRDTDHVVIDRVNRAIGAARATGVQIVFVLAGFRNGYPEISPHNRVFGRIARSGERLLSNTKTDLAPELQRDPADIIVVNQRASAFVANELEVILRAGGITKLTLAGISTGGVILATTRDAMDRDYELTVLSDACTDRDPEMHAFLLEKLLPRWATVLTVDEWVATLG